MLADGHLHALRTGKSECTMEQMHFARASRSTWKGKEVLLGMGHDPCHCHPPGPTPVVLRKPNGCDGEATETRIGPRRTPASFIWGFASSLKVIGCDPWPTRDPLLAFSRPRARAQSEFRWHSPLRPLAKKFHSNIRQS